MSSDHLFGRNYYKYVDVRWVLPGSDVRFCAPLTVGLDGPGGLNFRKWRGVLLLRSVTGLSALAQAQIPENPRLHGAQRSVVGDSTGHHFFGLSAAEHPRTDTRDKYRVAPSQTSNHVD